MANEDLLNQKTYCVLCTKEVPPERLKFRSVTCSEEHAQLRRRQLRKRIDDRECRFCHKASTPTQRRAFARFRTWERQNPAEAYPEAWAVLSAAGMTAAELGKAITQAYAKDVAIDSPLYWGARKTEVTTRNKEQDAKRGTPELDRAIEILEAHRAEHLKLAADAVEAVATAPDDDNADA